MLKTIREILDTIQASKASLEAIPTGFKAVDKWLDGGFFRKELVVIGAFTGTGKSYLAGQLFLTAARHGFKSAYFSLEISNEMVVSRLVGSLANLKPTHVRMGTISESEKERKLDAEVELLSLGELTAYYDSTYVLQEIVKEIEAHRFDYVVIDFIQNVIDQSPDEYAKLSAISLKLQEIAKKQNCCIVVLSQLSNSAAKEGSKGKIIEYKGSGNIATVADLGFFLEREQEENYQMSDNTLSLTIKKNRRGGAGVAFPLRFKTPGGWIYEQ